MTGGTILFGGSGFLGSYILARDPGIVSVGRSAPSAPNRHVHINSLADLSPIRDLPFDKVIYVVGHSDHHNLEAPELQPGQPTAYDYHLVPLLQTIEQLKERPIRKFIHFSTVLLYDEKRITLPVSEDAPIDPYRNRYVSSKYLAEEALKFYARWVPIINVRIANMYGPTPLTRYDLIHVVSRKLASEGRAEVWSTRPARDFIYVDDTARAVLYLLEADYTGTINLGSGVMTPVRRVLDLLAGMSGGTIVDRDQPVAGPAQFQVDLTTISRLIDWRPEVSIEEGVRRTYAFEQRRRPDREVGR